MSPSLPEKVQGCLIGAAVGDALGFPVEFDSMEAIRKKYGPSGIDDLVLRDLHGKPTAHVSDDTQVSMAVLHGLIKAGRGASADASGIAVAKELVEWSVHPKDGHRAPGGACLRGCARMATGTPWREAGGLEDGGCGATMRSHVYAAWHFPDVHAAVEMAVAHSGMTHRHPLALASCAGLVAGVCSIFRNDTIPETVRLMVEAARQLHAPTADMLLQAADDASGNVHPEIVFDRWRGWAAHECLAAALFCFLRAPDALRKCVVLGANSPGDSDSIASVAGALCGARLGLAAIPERWVSVLERREELLSLAASSRDHA